jgi:hypothetical protein
MPVDSMSAQVGASPEKGIGASDVQVPEARLYLLTAFVVNPLSTPPKT